MVSAAFPCHKRRPRVLGSEMAYVEVGEGDPIVPLHGNPTSSCLWRDVSPHLQPLGRCIAVSRADVAQLMLRVLEQPETVRETIGIALSQGRGYQ